MLLSMAHALPSPLGRRFPSCHVGEGFQTWRRFTASSNPRLMTDALLIRIADVIERLAPPAPHADPAYVWRDHGLAEAWAYAPLPPRPLARMRPRLAARRTWKCACVPLRNREDIWQE